MKKKISKDEIIKYYIDEQHTISECAKYFNISETTFKKYKREYSVYITNKKSRIKKELSESEKKAICEKRKNTLIKKYGYDNPMKVNEFKKKAQQTNLEKYGAENPNKNSSVVNKRKETNLKKYGYECSLQNNTVKEKARNTCKLVYGDIYPLRSDSKGLLLVKRKKTNLEKYGAEEITTSEYFKSIVKERCLKKYNTTSPNESIYSQTIFANSENAREYLEKFEKLPTIREVMDDLSLSDSYILKKIHILNLDDMVQLRPRQSHDEKEIIDFLKEIGVDESEIIHGDKCMLSGSEIDIYLPNYKLGIEYNGTYWHSDLYKSQTYHQQKSISAEKLGIQLIHVYEYEWKDERKREIVKSIIRNRLNKNTNKFFARKCIVKEIDRSDTRKFLENNHLQGYRAGSITYGLYLDDSLLQLIVFGKNNRYGWEIIRECCRINTTVVGGASKIIKYFIKNHNPDSIFSYSDFNKFSGNGYNSINMEFIGLTTPDLKWIINGHVYNRNPNKHKEMKENAAARIFGAGSKKYLIKFKNLGTS